jgi:predicted ABC-type ATPase
MRVAHRVQEGGHGLPPEIIRRRYFAGLSNSLSLYLPLADELEIYDNSAKRALIAKRVESGMLQILDSKRWSKLKRASRCDQ